MVDIKSEEKNFDLKNILKASGLAIAISLVLLLIFTVLLTYTSLAENTIPTVTIVISGISILFSSQLVTRKLKKNGIINGGLVGIIYILVLYLISSIVTKNFGFNLTSIIMCVVAFITGCVGGIVGINVK